MAPAATFVPKLDLAHSAAPLPAASIAHYQAPSADWNVPPSLAERDPAQALTPDLGYHPSPLHHSTPDEAGDYPYEWRGLIWQSIEFNLTENVFRVSEDYVMRDLLAHKPFWHDYLASMKQWNMRRWSDGDDFLVDEVGHPIQGAVSAYIEIQNSPKDSRIEWGDPGYWQSRWKGFLWATVFSTHEKISPAGEAGVGNDGGFTYGNQCHYTCTSATFGPGTTDTKYTNNTGWTDFIITPTVGMLWVLAEDVLDKDVSDRLRTKYPNKLWPKIVRGGLNPSRSYANMLRWQNPWYRDYEQPVPEGDRVRFFHSDDVEEAHRLARVQLAPYWSVPTVAANTAACFNCREFTFGGGFETITHLRGWLTFDTDVNVQPNASPLPSDRAGGSMTMALFGLGASKNWRYWGIHAALRPGLVRFSKAYETSPRSVIITTYPPGVGTLDSDPASHMGPGVIDANGTAGMPKLGDINHFDWNVNLSADYRISKQFGIRFGINDNMIRYRTDKVNAPGIGVPPYLSWLSRENFINRGNVGYQLGPVFSF